MDRRHPRSAPSRAATGRAPVVAVVVAVVAGHGAGCIILDSGIQIQRDFENPGAVRIVQSTPITPEADTACGERDGFLQCPQFGDTPSGQLAGNGSGQLCVCPQRDDNAPQPFEIFVEDPDLTADGRPKDDIFGAFLLNVDPDAGDPSQFLAYPNAVAPDEPAARFVGEVRTVERDTPGLRAFQVGGFTSQAFDVCNDNDGDKLEPGLHALEFIVTDRPWFAPAAAAPNGTTDGEPVPSEPIIGLPDLAAGATYARTSFVFRCVDSAGPLGGACGCTEDPQ